MNVYTIEVRDVADGMTEHLATVASSFEAAFAIVVKMSNEMISEFQEAEAETEPMQYIFTSADSVPGTALVSLSHCPKTQSAYTMVDNVKLIATYRIREFSV